MPSWKPVVAVLAISGAAIFVLFPDYLDLQTAPLVEDFLGVLGDDTAQASAAAVMDYVFAASYGLLGAILYSYVATGIPRAIGTAAIVGSAIADEVENTMVLLGAQRGSDTTQGMVDLMGTAGAIKWGLLVTSVVLLLALAGQRWLEERRA